MSFSITVDVKDGTASITSQSSGDAAPPDGTFYVNGHVGTDWSSVSVYCPVGTAAATINAQAPVAPRESQ